VISPSAPGQRHAALRTLALFVVLTALSACNLIPEAERYDVYQLPAASPEQPHAATSLTVLRVGVAASGDLLASNRIITVHDQVRMSSYAGARWASATPKLWQDHLVASLRRDGRLPHVAEEGDRVGVAHELRTTLHAFHIEDPADGGTARVAAEVRLIDVGNRHMIASQHFSAAQPLSTDSAETAARALGEATRTVTREIIDWSAEHLERTAAARAGSLTETGRLGILSGFTGIAGVYASPIPPRIATEQE